MKSKMTPSSEEVITMDTSEDIEGELEKLEEFDELELSWEESRELARTKDKRVMYWDKEGRNAKRTRIKPRASSKRPSEESDLFCSFYGREPEPAKGTGGFYESGLSPDGRD
jgi:hypothetical protein